MMDSVEQASGHAKRFGIITTDFETLEHILKASAEWYIKVIGRNGLD
ncbi:MAG: family 1 glycosylhydrolase [Lewinella sp.]|nr:family 1 glycosylhydrolase [Lewinella sp.]